jgi:hypothetical protein
MTTRANSGKRLGVWLAAALAFVCVLIVSLAWMMGPNPDSPDRHVPGATTGPGKNSLVDRR